MNLLAWMLSLTILVYLMVQAVTFHRATVCRQEAWLKSTELITRSKLYNPPPRQRDWHLGCRMHLLRDQVNVTWQTLPSLKKHNFELSLNGDL